MPWNHLTLTWRDLLQEQISPSVSALQTKARRWSRSRIFFIPWIGLIYSFGDNSGFDSRYSHWLGLRVCGNLIWMWEGLVRLLIDATYLSSEELWSAIATGKGARCPGGVAELLPSHAGGNHCPLGLQGSRPLLHYRQDFLCVAHCPTATDKLLWCCNHGKQTANSELLGRYMTMIMGLLIPLHGKDDVMWPLHLYILCPVLNPTLYYIGHRK